MVFRNINKVFRLKYKNMGVYKFLRHVSLLVKTASATFEQFYEAAVCSKTLELRREMNYIFKILKSPILIIVVLLYSA